MRTIPLTTITELADLPLTHLRSRILHGSRPKDDVARKVPTMTRGELVAFILQHEFNITELLVVDDNRTTSI